MQRSWTRSTASAMALCGLCLAGAQAAHAETRTFSYTGGEQTFTVPPGVRTVQMEALGGRGGDGAADGVFGVGGLPHRVSASLPVTPGNVLYVGVAGNGGVGGRTAGAGGYNGGADGGGPAAGGGGGASDVRSSPGRSGAYAPLIVAGGGGGGVDGQEGPHRADGGDAGQHGSPGAPVDGCAPGVGGQGGDQVAGGAGGAGGSRGATSALPGSPGSYELGGDGGRVPQDAPDLGAGGGGGGYHGGGGGGAGRIWSTPFCISWPGGGGGGSSYFALGSADIFFAWDATGEQPYVKVSYDLPPGGPGGGGGGAAGGGPAGGPGAGGGSDQTAPVLGSLTLSPSVFATRRGRTRRVGTTVSYRLSEPARVTFVIERTEPGVQRGGACVRGPRRARRNLRRCTRYVAFGSFTHAGAAGQNSVGFAGRVGGRRLAPARYRLVAHATDAAGNASRRESRGFRVAGR